jgi:hypothetical protein
MPQKSQSGKLNVMPGPIDTNNDRQTCENPVFEYPGRRMNQKNPTLKFDSFAEIR